MIKKLINIVKCSFFDVVFFALYVTFAGLFAHAIFDGLTGDRGWGWPESLWVMPIMWFFLMAARWFYKKAGVESKSGVSNNGGNNNHRRFRR